MNCGLRRQQAGSSMLRTTGVSGTWVGLRPNTGDSSANCRLEHFAETLVLARSLPELDFDQVAVMPGLGVAETHQGSRALRVDDTKARSARRDRCGLRHTSNGSPVFTGLGDEEVGNLFDFAAPTE